MRQIRRGRPIRGGRPSTPLKWRKSSPHFTETLVLVAFGLSVGWGKLVCTRRLGWSLSPHRVPANQRRPDAGPSRRPPLTARRTARRTVLVFRLHGGALAPARPAEPCLICHRCGAGLAPARPAGLQSCRHCRPAIGPAGGCAECEGNGIGPGAPELGGSRSRILRLGRGPSKRRPIGRGAVGAIGAVYCAGVCRQHRAAQ